VRACSQFKWVFLWATQRNSDRADVLHRRLKGMPPAGRQDRLEGGRIRRRELLNCPPSWREADGGVSGADTDLREDLVE